MNEDSIAYVLGLSYRGCVGMTGQDVFELYRYFLANSTLQSNPNKLLARYPKSTGGPTR